MGQHGATQLGPSRTTVARARFRQVRWARLGGLADQLARSDRPHQRQSLGHVRQRRPCSMSCRCPLGLVLRSSSTMRDHGRSSRNHFAHAEALRPMGDDLHEQRSSSCVLTLQDLGAAANAGHFLFPWGSQRHHPENADRFPEPVSAIMPVAGLRRMCRGIPPAGTNTTCRQGEEGEFSGRSQIGHQRSCVCCKKSEALNRLRDLARP